MPTQPTTHTDQLDYANVFDTLDTAYLVFDANDLTILEQNKAHADMTGTKRTDVIGKKILEAFPDNSDEYKQTGKSGVVESIRTVAKTGKAEDMPVYNFDIKGPSGEFETRYWKLRHTPLFAGKKVVAVIQESKDITARVLAEKELKRTQSQLELALTYSAVGTWLWDLGSDNVVADKNSAKLFGLGDGSSMYEGPLSSFVEAMHPDDVDRVNAEIRQALEDRSSYETEYRVKAENGGERWLLARGQVEVDDSGEPVQFPGLIVDITERKQSERRLHVLAEANTQFPASLGYRQTLDSIANKLVPDVADWCAIDLLEDGVIEQVAVAHKDPEKIEWARELRKKYGPVDPDAPTGSPAVIRTGKIEHVAVITDEMLQIAAQDEEQLQLLREVGMTSAITAPLIIEGKSIGAVTLISTDPNRHYGETDVELAKALANRAALAVYNATLFKEAEAEIKERKMLQKELEKLNAKLETRVAERTKELHKTNKGLEKEIARRKDVEAELQEYTTELARSNQELQDFAYVASHDLQEPLRKIRAFGDILHAEYSDRLGDGAEYLERMQSAASRMSTLIQDLLAFSRVSTREQVTEHIDLGKIVREVIIDLEWQIQDKKAEINIGELPVIQADATHMRQLFQNLIGNALKFQRPDVAPVITVELCDSDDPDMYCMCVQDNGIGFDERYLDRIFSVFQRLHGKDEYDGTGIGVAVVRKIVERYGGTITASSKKNVGSTFKVSFPKTLEETSS